jgi:transcriptional regulator with XRE-family HTH domain
MGIPSDELLRRKIRILMKLHRMTQIDLAARIDMSQSLLSRRLSGVQRFQITDLDAIARAFNITVPELFFDEYGQWDRRSGSDRRKSERRQLQQSVYDPRVEFTEAINRLSFPPKYKE